MIIRSLFIFLLFLILDQKIRLVCGLCETFAGSCSVAIGAAVNQGNDITLTGRSKYYFNFDLPSKSSSAVLLSSIFYGNCDLYVTYGELKEPTLFVHDLTSIRNGSADFLTIVSPHFKILMK